MAIEINDEELQNNTGGGGTPETMHIPTGYHVPTLVSYVELGFHPKMYNGKPAVYESGKKVGQIKPPEFMVSLTWEFSNVPYTGDYPLTFETSIKLQNGNFINAIGVTQEFLSNTISLAFANKTGYKRYRDAINLHCGQSFKGIHSAVGLPMAVNVATTAKYKDATGAMHAVNDNLVGGYNPENKGLNIEGVKYYTNMKPENIVPMQIDVAGIITDLSHLVAPVIGEYCPEFHWDAPTKEAWLALKPWQKKAIRSAMNFTNSPTDRLINSDPELLAELTQNTATQGDAQANQEAAIADQSTPAVQEVPATVVQTQVNEHVVQPQVQPEITTPVMSQPSAQEVQPPATVSAPIQQPAQETQPTVQPIVQPTVPPPDQVPV